MTVERDHDRMVRDWTSYSCQPSQDIISHLLQYNLDHVVLHIFRFVHSSDPFLKNIFRNLDSFTISQARNVSQTWNEFVGNLMIRLDLKKNNLMKMFRIQFHLKPAGDFLLEPERCCSPAETEVSRHRPEPPPGRGGGGVRSAER